jgi:DtxR family transcriptional regulator, Mn-dependent transcriptional regulator
MPMTQSLEDYLEAIYLVTLDRKVARVKDISDRLSVKKPSVINAIRELKSLDYLSQERYGYIEMTGKGLKQAGLIFKKHSMLKEFLMEVIGVSEKTAENDACGMEHILSGETLLKIERFTRKKKAK